jgi:magnesium chelatase subunit D
VSVRGAGAEPAFPFSAIVGHEPLAEALLACAVDPSIGGVLVRGERGTAKSTAVRALAPLLPPVAVADGCRFNAAPGDDCPDGPHDAGAHERPVALVELPIGATADRLLGSLDLERALRDGEAAFEPGLLAAAHRGVLYVDEVNLLPDHLVDVLLDAAAMGRAHVEREGVSASHAARFLLVGTMNPEEGDLRPQLLDRFGLSVEIAGSADPAERVEVIRRRLAFDADPESFRARFAADEVATAARIATARARLDRTAVDDRTLLLIASICASLHVDGLRADIVTTRTARALAALDDADQVTESHVRRAALLALAHRRRRGPLDPPGLTEQELDETIDQARAPELPEDPDDDPDPNGGPGSDEHRRENGHASQTGAEASASDHGGGGGSSPAEDCRRAEADDHSSTESSDAPSRPSSAGEDPSPAPRGSAPRRDAPGTPTKAPSLSLLGIGRGTTGRRSRASTRDGQPIDSRPPIGTVTDLALAATLRASARRQAPRPTQQDLREHIRTGREANLVVFCVDASGSMGARHRMATVKGAILGLLLDAYRNRDHVALITFRGDRADLALPPTTSVDRAATLLGELPTGGATPLATGLRRAGALVQAERRRDGDRRSLVLVVTDGRASGGPAGRQAAREAATDLARTADGVVVFDAEQGRIRLGLAGELAAAAGARLLPMTALPATHRRAAA